MFGLRKRRFEPESWAPRRRCCPTPANKRKLPENLVWNCAPLTVSILIKNVLKVWIPSLPLSGSLGSAPEVLSEPWTSGLWDAQVWNRTLIQGNTNLAQGKPPSLFHQPSFFDTSTLSFWCFPFDHQHHSCVYTKGTPCQHVNYGVPQIHSSFNFVFCLNKYVPQQAVWKFSKAVLLTTVFMLHDCAVHPKKMTWKDHAWNHDCVLRGKEGPQGKSGINWKLLVHTWS